MLRALISVLLLPLFAGCYATHHVPLNEKIDLSKANGVTMRSGRKIAFAVEGATIANDTLRAVGRDGTITVPTDSIAQISERRFSARNTVGLAVGVGAVAFAALVVLSYRSFAID
ncbi:MAG TPA: hypothetical protein VGO46_10440 [Gemmatimonadaceae bacterium]|nr:hypothetical protein [Gemmatimonadaceae bacterium]